MLSRGSTTEYSSTAARWLGLRLGTALVFVSYFVFYNKMLQSMLRQLKGCVVYSFAVVPIRVISEGHPRKL